MLLRLGIPVWIKWTVIVFCLLLLLSLVATGAYGYWLGRITTQQQNQQQLQALRQQMDGGIREGNLALALWAGEQLEDWGALDPIRQEQIAQLRERQQDLQRPPDITQPASPATVSAMPSVPENQHELWISAQTAFANGEWEQTIGNLTDLRAVDAKYITIGYLDLLEKAYVAQARTLIAQDRIEEALTQLQIALALRQSEYVQGEIDAAYLMTESLSFWGADWEQVIGALYQVYTYDPTYADIENRLTQALQLYYERTVTWKEYCSGYLFLASLDALVDAMDRADLRADLQQQCREATS